MSRGQVFGSGTLVKVEGSGGPLAVWGETAEWLVEVVFTPEQERELFEVLQARRNGCGATLVV